MKTKKIFLPLLSTIVLTVAFAIAVFAKSDVICNDGSICPPGYICVYGDAGEVWCEIDEGGSKTCFKIYEKAPDDNSLAFSFRVCDDCEVYWLVSGSENLKCK